MCGEQNQVWEVISGETRTFQFRRKPWLELELFDEEDEPCADEPYKVTFADGSVREGVLNEQGQAILLNVPPGECHITYPEMDFDAWDRAAA